MHEVKERYFAAMAAEITRHGGKIEKYIGDAIMAVFGLPRAARGRCAARGARRGRHAGGAAHASTRSCRRATASTLANRTGVNTGEVVANDDPTANQKLATGDAVNVTARLEQAAPANEIYLGDTTYRLVRDAVQVEAVEPLELKGKPERVAGVPARLGERARRQRAAARRADRRPRGRADGDRPGAARGRRRPRSARLITLIGDAGSASRGSRTKSSRVPARARGSFAAVACAYGDGITFWPLREMVSEAAEIRFEDAPEEARAKLAALRPRSRRRRRGSLRRWA